MSIENRLKRFWIGKDELRNWFNRYDGNLFIRVPKLLELPDDAYVQEVHYDWSYQGLGIVVRSESFPEIPDGQEVPMCLGEIEYETLALVDAIPSKLELEDGDILVFKMNNQGSVTHEMMEVCEQVTKVVGADLKCIVLPADIELSADPVSELLSVCRTLTFSQKFDLIKHLIEESCVTSWDEFAQSEDIAADMEILKEYAEKNVGLDGPSLNEVRKS